MISTAIGDGFDTDKLPYYDQESGVTKSLLIGEYLNKLIGSSLIRDG